MPAKRKHDQVNATVSVPATFGQTTASAETAVRFRKAARGYLNHDVFSDFTIICQGKRFKVHRCFISVHSRYFAKCCVGEFREASKREITLEEDLLEAVERMIAFFYVWDYDDELPGTTAEELESMSYEDPRPITRMQMNAHMFAIADKYEVPDLKALALEKFKEAACEIHGAEDAMPTIQRAIHTVFRHISVPGLEIDEFKGVLATLWTLGGAALLDGVSEDELTGFIGDVPEWGTFLVRFIMSDLHGDIYQACDECGQNESVDRMLITRKQFQCKYCKSLKPRPMAHDSARLVFDPFWERLYS